MMGKRVFGLLLILAMMATLLVPQVFADLAFETFYTESFASLSTDELAKWQNLDTTAFAITGGAITQNPVSWSGKPGMVYTGQNMSGTYKYTVDTLQNWGGAAANAGGVLFNFQKNFTGYCVKLEGGSTGTVVLQKYTGNWWNNIQTIATYSGSIALQNKNVRVEIIYENGGYITVDCVNTTDGKTTRVFDRVQDTSYISGYVGVLKENSGFAFDNVALARESAPIIAGPMRSFTPSDPAVARYLGRAYTTGATTDLRLPQTGLEFMTQNASAITVEAKFSPGSDNIAGQNMLCVYVDDSTTATRVPVAEAVGEVILATFDTPGTHKIKVTKMHGQNVGINISSIKAYGWEGGAAPVVTTSQPKPRKIEIVGDSITAGECITTFRIEESDRSYATLTAQHYGADLSLVGVSGGGFIHEANQDTYGLNPYRYYNMTFSWMTDIPKYTWDFNKFVPDLIVINLGTNGGATNTVDQYKRFITQVRGSYTNKNIPLIMALGSMNQDAWPILSQAATELIAAGDANLYSVQIGTGKTHGQYGHPDATEQQQTADLLIAKIDQVMPQWKDEISLTANKATMAVSVNFSAIRPVLDDQSGMVIGSILNAGGTMMGIASTPVSFTAAQPVVTGSLSIPTGNLTRGELHQIKLFLWDKDGLIPLANSDELTITP